MHLPFRSIVTSQDTQTSRLVWPASWASYCRRIFDSRTTHNRSLTFGDDGTSAFITGSGTTLFIRLVEHYTGAGCVQSIFLVSLFRLLQQCWSAGSGMALIGLSLCGARYMACSW